MIDHRIDGATALFDMAGFVVRAHAVADREWQLRVETTADRIGCSSCGVRAVGHGRRRVEVRDLPIAGRPVRLVWSKLVWRCVEPLCAAGRGANSTPRSARASLTRRARVEICRRVGEDATASLRLHASSGSVGPPLWPQRANTEKRSSMIRIVWAR